jgi:hypothetical protein
LQSLLRSSGPDTTIKSVSPSYSTSEHSLQKLRLYFLNPGFQSQSCPDTSVHLQNFNRYFQMPPENQSSLLSILTSLLADDSLRCVGSCTPSACTLAPFSSTSKYLPRLTHLCAVRSPLLSVGNFSAAQTRQSLYTTVYASM